MNQKLTYELPPTTGWRGFWDRGGFWKAVLVAVVYIALYDGFSFLVLQPLVADLLDTSNAFASVTNVLLGLALPVVFGSILLLLFGLSIGWFPRPLFGAQPIRGRWWMWIAPVLVLIPIVFHLIGTDYSRYTPGIVLSTLFAGLFIGFAEEVLCRGFVVGFLRRHGYREWAVMALSSLVFGLLHSSNVLSGQDVRAVAVEVLYALAFGVCMYLTLRVTGNLIWPILLHAFTDPTTALASGGIDETVTDTANTALTIAVIATFAYIGFALIGVIGTRGHAHGRAEKDEGPRRTSIDEDTQPTRGNPTSV